MAKAKATRIEKGRAGKYVNEYRCNGGCGGYDGRLCPECADWGDLRRGESNPHSEEETQTTP